MIFYNYSENLLLQIQNLKNGQKSKHKSKHTKHRDRLSSTSASKTLKFFKKHPKVSSNKTLLNTAD